MSENYDIIVSGHLCLDLIPEMDSVPLSALASPGQLFEIGPLQFSTGGAVSNTGLALHRLGVNVRLMSTVGEDLLGRVIIAFLNDRDPVLTQLLTKHTSRASSYTVVLSPQRADRSFLHHTGTNTAFGINDIDFAILEKARIFHLGYPPLLPRLVARDGQEMREIFARAQSTGVVTALDTTLPDPQSATGQLDWPAILRNTLPHVDIFIPSIEEILFMLRRTDFDRWQSDGILSHLNREYLSALADEILASGVAITGFKLGELGFYLKTAPADRIRQLRKLTLDAAQWDSVELWTPAYEVEVVNTIGAGDSAYGAFLAGLLRGFSPQEAMQWACAVGACNVEAADATSGVRSWADTEARMQAGWPQRQDKLPGMT